MSAHANRYDWRHFVALWLVGSLIYFPQYAVTAPELPLYRHFAGGMFSGTYYALAWLLGYKLAVHFRRGRALSTPHLAAIVTSVLLLVLVTRVLQYFAFGPLGYLRPDETLGVVLSEAYTPYTVTHYTALVAAAHWLHYQEEFDRSNSRTETLEIQLTKARAQVLQGQLHPHFLFNALNSIAALVRLDPVRATNAIDRLESLFLAVTRDRDASLIPLEEEAQLLESYLAIEKLRYGPRLNVVISISPDTKDVRVPPLLLQPIVENSVRHGTAMVPGPQFICVLAFRNGGNVRIVVRDDGPGFPKRYVEGIGLRNTRSRLRLIGTHGGRSLSIVNMPSGGCEVTIDLVADEVHA